LENFQKKKQDLDPFFRKLRKGLQKDEVVRHVGELDLETGILEVKLTKEKRSPALGSLKYAESSFEIFSECYQNRLW